jgi:hypothetical protein
MKHMFTFILSACMLSISAQDIRLPYNEIPSYPKNFTAGTVAARMIDGLGFRYYWATDGLGLEDLGYKPGADTRTTEETLAHIYEMSLIIVNSVTNTINVRGTTSSRLAFADMRKSTLENLKTASDRLLIATEAEMNDFKLIFERDGRSQEFPFWNQINGPIADCLWHVGQVVSFRRASGNPFTDKVSVFAGTVRKQAVPQVTESGLKPFCTALFNSDLKTLVLCTQVRCCYLVGRASKEFHFIVKHAL